MQIGYNYPGITIVYFCNDGEGNFVMSKRSNNTRDEHGRWDIGGGKLEYGETVKTTLQREVKEEYCTIVLDFKFLGYREIKRKHGGRNTHWIALDFKCLVDPEKVKNGEPHKFEEVSWFTLKNMPKNLHSQLPLFLKKYKSDLKI